MSFFVSVFILLTKYFEKLTDSTTDTNETEANTVEMFSPPPPYPDELNYHYDVSPNGYEVT